MKKLSKSAFDRAADAILEYARPLERSIFLHHFRGGGEYEILKELKAFQNADGGFGHGLESDFRMPDSSPKATAIGVRLLSGIDELAEARDMIKLAVNYFEATYEEGINGWLIASKAINDYPHAPWWHFNERAGMTLLDLDWGNASAEIAAHLYKYQQFTQKLDVNSIIEKAIKHLAEKKAFTSTQNEFISRFDKVRLPEFVSSYYMAEKSFDSRGEIFSYIKLYKALPEELKERLERPLRDAISQIVEYDSSKWTNYVPAPVDFVGGPESDYFGVDKSKVEENLDFIVEELELDGRIYPSWAPEKRFYQGDLAPAYNEWVGAITLGNLLKLRSFRRI